MTTTELVAEYRLLKEFDTVRARLGHDYGCGQRAHELWRYNRLLAERGIEVYDLPEVSKEEIELAFVRVGQPKVGRIEREDFRRSTPATKRTLQAWRTVETWAKKS